MEEGEEVLLDLVYIDYALDSVGNAEGTDDRIESGQKI